MVVASRCPLVPDHENVHADREGTVSRRHLGRFSKCDFYQGIDIRLTDVRMPNSFSSRL